MSGIIFADRRADGGEHQRQPRAPHPSGQSCPKTLMDGGRCDALPLHPSVNAADEHNDYCADDDADNRDWEKECVAAGCDSDYANEDWS